MHADLYRDLTMHVLRRAGLVAGMDVLDIGCGGGDVSLLAGRLVGPDGSVVGIDRNASALDKARQRAAAEGLAHLRFETADLGDFEPADRFDAVVGRFVLLYMPDPAAFLRRARR